MEIPSKKLCMEIKLFR